MQLFAKNLVKTLKHGSLHKKVASFGEIDTFWWFFTKCHSFCNFLLKRWSKPRGVEESYSAWHLFCVRIIQEKVTSHPVRERATSLPGAKTKIYGNRFFYSVSKMMIFCNRLHIFSFFRSSGKGTFPFYLNGLFHCIRLATNQKPVVLAERSL